MFGTATGEAAGIHGAPHRHRVSPWLIFGAMWAGPAAWFVQLVSAYGLSSNACGVGAQHGSASRGAALVITVICALAAAGACLVSHRIWRNTRDESHGGTAHLIAGGEGRTRFLALVGTIMAAGAVLAILFVAVGAIAVPCAR